MTFDGPTCAFCSEPGQEYVPDQRSPLYNPTVASQATPDRILACPFHATQKRLVRRAR